TFVDDDNQRRPHQGRWCYGKTPMQTLLDSLALAKETLIASPRARPPGGGEPVSYGALSRTEDWQVLP
ncbi:MAG TPA: hypothetical protein VHJ77_16375, partial [Vicinamibacterales bacterium]|nr:hypothetical protein [Vicinamibacterales bacterium]